MLLLDKNVNLHNNLHEAWEHRGPNHKTKRIVTVQKLSFFLFPVQDVWVIPSSQVWTKVIFTIIDYMNSS